MLDAFRFTWLKDNLHMLRQTVFFYPVPPKNTIVHTSEILHRRFLLLLCVTHGCVVDFGALLHRCWRGQQSLEHGTLLEMGFQQQSYVDCFAPLTLSSSLYTQPCAAKFGLAWEFTYMVWQVNAGFRFSGLPETETC